MAEVLQFFEEILYIIFNIKVAFIGYLFVCFVGFITLFNKKYSIISGISFIAFCILTTVLTYVFCGIIVGVDKVEFLSRKYRFENSIPTDQRYSYSGNLELKTYVEGLNNYNRPIRFDVEIVEWGKSGNIQMKNIIKTNLEKITLLIQKKHRDIFLDSLKKAPFLTEEDIIEIKKIYYKYFNENTTFKINYGGYISNSDFDLIKGTEDNFNIINFQNDWKKLNLKEKVKRNTDRINSIINEAIIKNLTAEECYKLIKEEFPKIDNIEGRYAFKYRFKDYYINRIF